jgi:hypothetical protein
MNDKNAIAILEKSRRLLVVSRNLLRVLATRLDASRPVPATAPAATRSRSSQRKAESARK